VLPSAEFEFAWHEVHAVAPPSEKVASVQFAHSCVSSAAEYAPAAQGIHNAPDKR
jgi:hypothetical protein